MGALPSRLLGDRRDFFFLPSWLPEEAVLFSPVWSPLYLLCISLWSSSLTEDSGCKFLTCLSLPSEFPYLSYVSQIFHISAYLCLSPQLCLPKCGRFSVCRLVPWLKEGFFRSRVFFSCPAPVLNSERMERAMYSRFSAKHLGDDQVR